MQRWLRLDPALRSPEVAWAVPLQARGEPTVQVHTAN